MTKRDFAYFSDDIYDRKAAKDMAEILLLKINQFCPKAKKILELGAGTGNVMENFPKNYSLYGIDSEEKYLKIAKKKIKKGNFTKKSMGNFRFRQKFDVVFCVNSINYLSNFYEWKSTFRNVSSHLNKDSIFVFEMLTEKALEKYRGHKGPLRLFAKGYCAEFKVVNGETITTVHYIFEKRMKNEFLLHKFESAQRVVPIGQIKTELKSLFMIVDFMNIDDTHAMFVCRKNLIRLK